MHVKASKTLLGYLFFKIYLFFYFTNSLQLLNRYTTQLVPAVASIAAYGTRDLLTRHLIYRVLNTCHQQCVNTTYMQPLWRDSSTHTVEQVKFLRK